MTDSFRAPEPAFAGLRGAGGQTLHAEWFESDCEDGTADPVLLLSEAEAPSSRWPDRLIGRLVADVGPVLRFDTRDVGRSPAADDDYALTDLAADAVALLGTFGADRAHVLGRSMGGMVAQLMALHHGTTVRSLTLLSTSPGEGPQLPDPAEWLVERMAQRHLGPTPQTDDEKIRWIVDQWEWFAGSRFGFDRQHATERAIDELAWWRPGVKHGRAVVEAPSWFESLATVDVPTVVVHGTADPVYAVEHALAIVDRLPHAQLELVEGLGHELPDGFSDQLADVVQEVVART
jgi:pimeloyl-ACP methyl ester carboxylesterase